MNTLRCGSPISTAYCRASLSAASIASEPPDDEVNVRETRRRAVDERIGERFGDVGREEARMRVGNAVDLRVHRREHVRMSMAKARHGRPAARVDVALAVAIDDFDACGRRHHRRHCAQVAVHHVAHRGPPQVDWLRCQ